MTDRIDDFDDDDDVISIDVGAGQSRRSIMKQLGAAGLAGGLTALAGCSGLRDSSTPTPGDGSSDGGDSESTPPSSGGGGGQSGEKESIAFERVDLVPPPTAENIDNSNPIDPQRRMVLVNQNGENQFWVPCIAGLHDALKKMGWKGQMLAPNGYDETKQIEILNTTIDKLESGRDAIGSTIMGAQAYQDPVKKALDNDIMFYQWNTTVPKWTPDYMRENIGRVIPYVGQRAFRSGWAVAHTADEFAQEKFSDDKTLKVLPTLSVPGHPALENRIRGVRAFFESRDRYEVMETLDIGLDIAEGTTKIQNRYSAEPYHVLCGCGFWGPTAAASLIENEGLQGEFVTGGFDLVESILNGIENGKIDFTVGQDPYSQGFMPVILNWAYYNRGVMPKDYVTGAELVTQDNLEFGRQRSGDWPALLEYQRQNYDVN
ncbi:MAG: substrate-binding domain-containing protein [Haloarculaceae archaeon]